MAEVLCYNRGCGKTYDPRKNPDDSQDCVHHPGAPFFHETYKGWSCCGRKSVDFTEFLNTPGCRRGPHSHVKPIEPESITGKKDDRTLEEQMAEVEKHRSIPSPPADRMKRPDFSTTALTRIKPIITASSLKPSGEVAAIKVMACSKGDVVSEGEACKNGGCNVRYGSPSSSNECNHHPGVPIFHEGMKYWSCCQRKTSDFTTFLKQQGCTLAAHKWKKDSKEGAAVDCRYDWHQTAGHVTVAIYAKKYDAVASHVEVGPVRLKVHIYFGEQGEAFDLDLELKGIVRTEECSCLMAETKVEIKMEKAEAGSWSMLAVPRTVSETTHEQENAAGRPTADAVTQSVDVLDLDDIDFTPRKPILSRDASGGRTDAEIK